MSSNGRVAEGQHEEVNSIKAREQEANKVISIGKLLGRSFGDQESEMFQKIMEPKQKSMVVWQRWILALDRLAERTLKEEDDGVLVGDRMQFVAL